MAKRRIRNRQNPIILRKNNSDRVYTSKTLPLNSVVDNMLIRLIELWQEFNFLKKIYDNMNREYIPAIEKEKLKNLETEIKLISGFMLGVN